MPVAEDYVPQPRYSEMRKDQAATSERPLFTLDLYWFPTKRRSTETGVLTEELAEKLIQKIRAAVPRGR